MADSFPESDSTLARCVERLLGEAEGSAPLAPDELGEWLAARGLVRVPVADPASFSMAGSFLGRFESGWALLFGIPPGPLFDPAGASGTGPMLEAAVIAPLQLPRQGRPGPDGRVGRVEEIAIAAKATAPMRRLERVEAIAGAGLSGDRYAAGAGTFSTKGGSGRDLTLVDGAALDALISEGTLSAPSEARRNLVVRGIDLDGLIGRRFRVGTAECRGARRCEPCAHLERLTRPGVLRGLVHRGGLRADVLGDGAISVGDEVVALD